MNDTLPTSLGYRTDLALLALSGARITARADCTVIETPSNHAFHWGNFLLFPQAPTPEDFTRWPRRFKEELGHLEGVHHVAFGWDDPSGARGASDLFVAAGYRFDSGVVMTARAIIRPARAHPTLEVRPLTSDEDWRAATEIQIASADAVFDEAAYRRFKQAQMNRFRRMTERGELRWLGGFEGGALIANLGISLGDGVRRFQSVATHPERRREGACARLVYEASAEALSEGAEVLVMVADELRGARRVYARVGFELTERQVGVTLIPSAERVAASQRGRRLRPPGQGTCG